MNQKTQTLETGNCAGIAGSLFFILAMGMTYSAGMAALILLIIGQFTFVAIGGRRNVLLKQWRKKTSSFIHDIQASLTSSAISLARKSKNFRHPSVRHPNQVKSHIVFIKEIIANPRSMGAVCPSSQRLAKTMAAMADDKDDTGIVVELGGGTGTVTRALLQQGIAPERLITIERSPALAAHLRQLFPDIRVIEGDATCILELLGADSHNVRAVVSGLPLRSLPTFVVKTIMRQVNQLLQTSGTFIQFTYDLRTPSVEKNQFHAHINSKIVWKNLPPARVDAFSNPIQ